MINWSLWGAKSSMSRCQLTRLNHRHELSNITWARVLLYWISAHIGQLLQVMYCYVCIVLLYCLCCMYIIVMCSFFYFLKRWESIVLGWGTWWPATPPKQSWMKPWTPWLRRSVGLVNGLNNLKENKKRKMSLHPAVRWGRHNTKHSLLVQSEILCSAWLLDNNSDIM